MSGSEIRLPSATTKANRYVPGRVGTNVAEARSCFQSARGGPARGIHRNPTRPEGVLPEPSSLTARPTTPDASGPASAFGAEASVIGRRFGSAGAAAGSSLPDALAHAQPSSIMANPALRRPANIG